MQCSNLVVYKYVANEDSATRKMYKNFYKYIVEDVKTQINFFTSLNIDETISRGASCRCIISGIDYVFHHYFKYFSYEKAVEFTNQFFKNFETFFINKDKNIEMFLINTFNGKTTLNIYKKLVSNNGVLKYCKYTKLKMNLKKIKILNRLNNWLKGRK